MTIVSLMQEACGKLPPPEGAPDDGPAPITVTADSPGAVITDDVLMKLKGRWIKELHDPNTPDPNTMRLFARGHNVLGGRFLVAGGLADTGVEATLKFENGEYTFILRDDESRPHGAIPKERIFTGKYDAEKKQLELKTKDGEWVLWQLLGGYKALYSANVSHCTVVLTPVPSDGPTPSPTPRPTPRPIRFAALDADPPLNRRPPVSKIGGCGMMSTYEDEWSRMSGAE